MNTVTNNDIRTQGFVLRRTNYGEADRILNIITPLGKFVVIAKSVRKSKSKLAGSVEMFSLIDFNIHQGRSEFGVVTGAKMLEHYGEILHDYRRMELAGLVLKKISQAAESANSEEYFNITKQCLVGLNAGLNTDLIEAWFLLHLMKVMGEEMNLYRDINGEKLVENENYSFDNTALAFMANDGGEFGTNEIKFLRLLVTSKLNVVQRVKVDDSMIREILDLVRVVAHL
ncbi:DNA repair protein RecO [Candidatus Saccharibacteria bacterium]|nr:DNA repair protein RecO [Candidatus Saccharibacteria bacterium]